MHAEDLQDDGFEHDDRADGESDSKDTTTRISAFINGDDSLDDDEWHASRHGMSNDYNGSSDMKDSEWDIAPTRRPSAGRAEAKSGEQKAKNKKKKSKNKGSKQDDREVEVDRQDGVKLIESVKEGAFDKVELMLQKDPKCHEFVDSSGSSALMHAVEREDHSMFILLVSNGADLSYTNKKNGFNVLQLANSTQINLMCKRALKGFQLVDPKHFKHRDLNPKKFVAMTGEVEQERVRGTKSVVKGFIKMVWKEVQMAICGKEISLWKSRYGEDEIIAFLDLVDVNECGNLAFDDSSEHGFYFKTDAQHVIQFRVSSKMELDAWMFAVNHNHSPIKRVDGLQYNSKASWEVHWAS